MYFTWPNHNAWRAFVGGCKILTSNLLTVRQEKRGINWETQRDALLADLNGVENDTSCLLTEPCEDSHSWLRISQQRETAPFVRTVEKEPNMESCGEKWQTFTAAFSALHQCQRVLFFLGEGLLHCYQPAIRSNRRWLSSESPNDWGIGRKVSRNGLSFTWRIFCRVIVYRWSCLADAQVLKSIMILKILLTEILLFLERRWRT